MFTHVWPLPCPAVIFTHTAPYLGFGYCSHTVFLALRIMFACFLPCLEVMFTHLETEESHMVIPGIKKRTQLNKTPFFLLFSILIYLLSINIYAKLYETSKYDARPAAT